MATPVFGESSSTASGTQYRYITAAYVRNAAAGPLFLYFCGVNYGKGYGAAQAGSLVQVNLTGAASPSGTTDVQIYKNNSLWFTAISGLPITSGPSVSTSVSYAPGVKTYAANDYFDVYLTSNSGGLYFGATLLFAEPGP